MSTYFFSWLVVTEGGYLLLHYDPRDGSLDHVGSVQTVHTVDSEDTLLLTDDSSLIHPDTEGENGQLGK